MMKGEFRCDDSRIYALVGDILASCARSYKGAIKSIRKARRKLSIGEITKEEYDKIEKEKMTVIYMERLFIMSDTFKILLGNSNLDGQSIINEIEKNWEKEFVPA